MAVRAVISEKEDSTESAWVIGATNYATAMGTDIVNMSFSTDTTSTIWHDAISAACDSGIIFVSSAGNRGAAGSDLATITKRYPQWWPEVMCVAAVDSLGYKTTVLSNWGDSVDVCGYSNKIGEGPGAGNVACIYDTNRATNCDSDSLYPGSQYPHQFFYTGLYTSGACAEVVGVLALLKALYPDSSAAFLKHELYRGAIPLPDTLYAQGKLGAGAVNAYRSLTQWGHVRNDTTWSGTVYVSGDVVVDSGATLTIDAGTNVIVWNDDVNHAINPWTSPANDTSRCEIWVEGFLDVNGTQAFPVTFRAFAPTGEGAGTDDWFGIHVTDSTTTTGAAFDYCTVKNARNAISTNTFISVKNSTIKDCERLGISVAYADSVYLENVTISGADLGNVNIVQNSVVRMKDCIIEDADEYGIRVLSGSTLYLEDSRISDCDVGIWAWIDGGDPVTAYIDACSLLTNNDGLYVKTPGLGARVEVTNCIIEDNTTTGVFCDSSAHGVVLRENEISGSAAGVYMYLSHGKVRKGNVITGNTVGIKLDMSSDAVVESTTVTSNATGIAAINDADPDLGGGGISNGRNILSPNTNYFATNGSALTIKAENNYWGSSRGDCFPKASKIVGSFDYDPALCAAPTLASPPMEEDESDAENRIKVFALSVGMPNPFNPTVSLAYEVPYHGGNVSIVVYDVAGRAIKVLANEYKTTGRFMATWDGQNNAGESVASGVYFIRMQAPSFSDTKKVVLVK
jgi:parallel beta-helix repeat protein